MTTPYIETEALIAIMEGDQPRAEELLTGMSSTELRTFSTQVVYLADTVSSVRRKKAAARLAERMANP